MIERFLHKYVGTKDFYKYIIAIAIPVMLQLLLQTSAQLVDNVMVGTLGAEAIASVGIANQIYFVVILAFMGVSEAGQMYIAQYNGNDDEEGISHSFRSALILGFGLGLIAFIVVNVYGIYIVRLFTTDDSVIATTMRYIRITSVTYLLSSISFVFSSGFRAVSKTKIPMYIGFFTVITNSILNFFFIYGINTPWFELPPLGIVGAGIATVIARIIETLCFFIISYSLDTKIRTNFIDLFTIKGSYFKNMFRKALPLTTNEFLWSFGQTTLTIIYSQQVYQNVAAFNISNTFANMFFIISSAMATAISIVIGNSLGKNELHKAKDEAYKLIVFAGFMGILAGIGLNLCTLLVPIFFNVEPEVLHTAQHIMRIVGFMLMVYFATGACFFTLRAGGDTRSVLMMDAMYSWFVFIPAAFILRSVFDLPLTTSYIIIQVLEYVKLYVATTFVKKGRWVQNLTIS